MLYLEDLTEKIIGAAIEVHRTLGPGLLESAYQECLAQELTLRKVPFAKEKNLPVEYKGIHVDCGYRIDFLIDNQVIVELKAVEAVLPIHRAQLITYLKLTGCKVGLLINFNVQQLIKGIERLAN
ncbi:MAG: GxxExxY protein [Chloroflexi bacterium]|nr:MAG: GxxExxY protein [Chloroflexota bacterium]